MRAKSILYMTMALIIGGVLSGCATTERAHPSSMESLYSSVLLCDGTPLSVDADYLVLYYAADWCPSCRAYAQELKSSYAALKELWGSSFELVFVGHANDTDNEQLIAFMEMGAYPFGYLPFEKRASTGVMALMGEGRFYIPGLLLIDREGVVLSSSNGPTASDYVRDRPFHLLRQRKIEE